MCHVSFMQSLRQRTRELFDLLNVGDVDGIVGTYSEAVRFSITAKAGQGGDARLHTGEGHEEARAFLLFLRESFAPFTLVDVFGVNSMRSLIVDDRFGGRFMFSAEVNRDGLADVVFGVRIAAPARLDLAA